jgi:predicted aspartyl protease
MRRWMLVFAALGLFPPGAPTNPADIQPGAGADAAQEELQEIVVTAPEPIYAAPTTRDRIGRVWVPVYLDGAGPFRLVLDTGAQRSAIVPQVATRLGIPLDRTPPVRVHGATGTAISPTVEIETLRVGDLWLQSALLPVVADVFGGAEGLLGMDGMQDRRIYIDFRSDYVDIRRSRGQRPPRDFVVVPMLRKDTNLVLAEGEVAGVPVRAIIDTGAQATVGNEALRVALRRHVRRHSIGEDEIHGATGATQTGIGARVSSITMGGLKVLDAHVTFSDLHIFSRWDLADTPALLVGMDILGLTDTLVIDFSRKEVQIRPRRGLR